MMENEAGERLEALQLPGTLMERLSMATGQPVVVYLRGVHAELLRGVPPLPPGEPCPPWEYAPPGQGTGSSGSGGTWGREPSYPGPGWPGGPGMGPGMGMRTTVISGILVFAGADFLVLHVPIGAANPRELLIPYTAIGIIVPGGPQL